MCLRRSAYWPGNNQHKRMLQAIMLFEIPFSHQIELKTEVRKSPKWSSPMISWIEILKSPGMRTPSGSKMSRT